MKKGIKNIVLVLLVGIGLSAIFSGFELVTEPDGSSLGLSTTDLNPRYFTDFGIPGFVLLIAIGFMSIILFSMILADLKKCGSLLAIQGFILLGFIIVQLVVGIPLQLLHVACIAIAIVFILTGLSRLIDVD